MSLQKFYDHGLNQFLESRRTSDATLTTMSGMGEMKGKWKISDEDYPAFLDHLHNYIFELRGRCLNLVERPRRLEPKPLLIDLDFRYPIDTSVRRSFSIVHIEKFIQLVVKGIDYFFGVEGYNKLRFFVTLRPSPYTEKGKRKDGVHILSPDIALTNDKQSVLRKWILSQQGIRSTFNDTGYVNADEDVYDESMTRTQGWIFYGESKPNIAPYQLESIYTYKPNDDQWIDEDTGCYSSRDLMELLSIRYNINPDISNLKPGEPGELYAALLNQGNVPLEGVSAAGAPLPRPADNEMIEVAKYFSPPTTDNERAMIRRFVLECLNKAWYEEYDKWIRVGWCLHNIEASEEMFNLWMDFSDKSSKASENNRTQLHHDWMFGMRKIGDGPRLTERSLRKWARDDNPEAYNTIVSEDIQEYIRTNIEPTHFHIAKLMRKMYGNNYIASVNPRSTEWFKYDDAINMWKRLNQGIELRSKISDEVAAEFDGARGILRRLIGDKSTKEEQRKWMEDKIKDLLKCEMQLYNNGFTEGVMKMASQQFCEEDFMNKLNVNPYLFGCCNGMLELRAKDAAGKEGVIFRQGRPEDYVSFLAGRIHAECCDPIPYIPYDPHHPIQHEITDFLTKVFPNPELRAYVLRLLSSCLEGANREQCYYTFNGGGGNGKSKIVDLMRLTLGDYQTSMSTTVLTRKRPDSGAANPEIIVAKSRRFIYMGEPDENEPINTSVMKQFSGEDVVEARALYGEQEKFRIMGKIFMMCNKLPPVTSMDEGTWRRIRVIPFESSFLAPDNPELLLNKPNTFPRDPQMNEKLVSWRVHFLSLLVHIYETQYIVNGLSPVPDVVMKESNKYKQRFDVFASFEADRIRTPKTIDEQIEFRSNPIDTNRITSIFNAWKKEYKFGGLTARDVITRLETKYGSPERGRFWSSFVVFDSDDRAIEWDKAHAPTESV